MECELGTFVDLVHDVFINFKVKVVSVARIGLQKATVESAIEREILNAGIQDHMRNSLDQLCQWPKMSLRQILS